MVTPPSSAAMWPSSEVPVPKATTGSRCAAQTADDRRHLLGGGGEGDRVGRVAGVVGEVLAVLLADRRGGREPVPEQAAQLGERRGGIGAGRGRHRWSPAGVGAILPQVAAGVISALQSRGGRAHSRAPRQGGPPWTCSTPRSASARTPTRPIPGSRSARRSAARDGSVFAGCNVENVAYPEGTCAEAGAIAAMVAAGRTEIAEVVVVADSPTPVTPCGGCRQKLAEFAPPEAPVVLAGLGGELARTTVGALLPGAFAAAHMARDAERHDRPPRRRGPGARLPRPDQPRRGCDAAAIAALCDRARTPHGPVAAVCVWPDFVAQCRAALAGSGIRVATVVNFPTGDDDVSRCATRPGRR